MIAVSPDGRMVATSSSGAVHLWDAATGEEVDHLPLGRRLERVTVHFHPDGQSLLYSGLGLGVQQMELKRTESATPDQRSVEFGARRQISPGSEYLLEGIAPDQRSLIVRVGPKLSLATVWLWPNGDANHARPLTDGSPITSYHLTANGLWGLSAHWTEPDVWVWDPQTARRVRRLGLSVGADATAAPDDRWVLVTTSEHYQLWEVGSWKPGATWPHALQRYDRAGAFSADGRWLATAGDEGRVEIRSLPEADVVLNLPPPHPLRLHDLVFSPDRQRLYLLQGNGRLFEWDLEQVRRELSRRGLDWAD